MIAVDFFCGAGGLTRGLLDAGIEVVMGIDADSSCRKTYEENNKPARFLCADIRKLQVKVIANELIGSDPKNILLAGCAPCQPFSKQRREKDYPFESTLLAEFLRFIKIIRPGNIFVENVPGIAKVGGRSTLRRFVSALEKLGYRVRLEIVDAKIYGTPQTRRRFVLMASSYFIPTLPQPTHGTGLQPFRTVRDAIKSYPPIRAGETHESIPNHRASALSEHNLKRIKITPKNGGGRLSWPKRLRLECHSKDYEGHTDVYGRMWWDRPAPALTGKCVSLSNGRYGHPSQNRAISLREAAKLQGFKDDYVFYEKSKGQMSLHIGNAVPVPLAHVVGKHFLEMSNQSVRINLAYNESMMLKERSMVTV